MSHQAPRGFGKLIERARIQANMTPEALAERLGYKSKSIVYRLESEAREPDVAIINGLVAALPISAETLLEAMGVNLSRPLASRIHRQLVEMLALATPEQQHSITELLQPLLATPRDQR